MSEPFLGQITHFAGNFAPRGWAFCEGQLLPISQNTALFSLLGTIYGGDGRTTFALPDLRGRAMIGPGRGPGLTPFTVGQKGGAETETLTTNQLPSHTHALHGETARASTNNPEGGMLALPSENIYAAPAAADNKVMAAESIVNTGGGQAFSIRDPYLAIWPIIALVGIFPSSS